MSRKLSIRNRPTLPPGISYHKNTAGIIRYRIRIRSIKKLEKLGRIQKDSQGNIVSIDEIDEIYDTLKGAETRLQVLKYDPDTEKAKLYEQVINSTTYTTMEELLQAHYDFAYKKRPTKDQLKSRINVINGTSISIVDHRPMKFLGQMIATVKNGLPDDSNTFGKGFVKDYKKLIEQFIETRLYSDKVKPQTVNNDLTIISSALKNAHHYLAEFKDSPIVAPMAHIKKLEPELKPKEDKRLTHKQQIEIEKLFIEKSRKDHYHEFLVFMLESGCRLSEALSILITDIDLPNRTIRISTLKRKQQHIRYIAITDKMLPIVKKYSDGKKMTDKLFVHSKNTYGTKLKQMKKHLAEAGLNFHWHKARHTFASANAGTKNTFELAYVMGITDTQHLTDEYLQVIHSENIARKKAQAGLLTSEELQQYLGHATPEETSNTYIHFEPENMSNADLLNIIGNMQKQIQALSNKIEDKDKEQS